MAITIETVVEGRVVDLVTPSLCLLGREKAMSVGSMVLRNYGVEERDVVGGEITGHWNIQLIWEPM